MDNFNAYHVKDEKNLQLAEEIFNKDKDENSKIKITLTGERHLGAVIGSPEFRTKYVKSKIESWIEDVEQLAEIAENEPQLAYSAYTKALCMRWCFLQRTVPDTKDFFIPLEEAIRERLIPAIIGRKITDLERQMVSLPVRMGGLGIQNPVMTADTEFRNSCVVTENLKTLIVRQETDLTNYNITRVKADIARLKLEKEESLLAQLEEVKDLVDHKLKRSLELAAEKGAGA